MREIQIDEQTRAELVDAYGDGLSLREAAVCAGISHDDMWAAIEADPSLRMELQRAEVQLKRAHLRNIRAAAEPSTETNAAKPAITSTWRVSAWWLERRYPSEFAKRIPQAKPSEDQRRLWADAATTTTTSPQRRRERGEQQEENGGAASEVSPPPLRGGRGGGVRQPVPETRPPLNPLLAKEGKELTAKAQTVAPPSQRIARTPRPSRLRGEVGTGKPRKQQAPAHSGPGPP